MRDPAEFTPEGKVTAGMLGTCIVALSLIDRLSAITASTATAPVLFCSSFLRGLSKSTPRNSSLYAATILRAENSTAQNFSPVLQQMIIDFNSAYTIQEELFAKASDALSKSDLDEAKSLLKMPADLVLNRTARATFLRRFGNTKQSKENLDTVDSIGHAYSAASSVILINTCRLGENLGELARAASRLLPTLLQPTIKDTVQLYFVAHFFNNEVINSPIGIALGLPDILQAVSPSTKSLLTLAKNTTKAVIKNSLDMITKPLSSILTPLSYSLDALRQVNAPVGQSSVTETIGSVVGGAIGTLGILGGEYSKGAAIGILAVNSLLTAKTYVIAPALAGIYDGLLEPIPSKAVQTVDKAVSSVTPVDRKALADIFISANQDFNKAYNNALQKFQKYDKALKDATTEKSLESEATPMAEILEKNPSTAKKTDTLLGREILLESNAEGIQQAVSFTDKVKAAAQAGASLIALTSYRVGKAVPKFVDKFAHRGAAKNKRWNNRKI